MIPSVKEYCLATEEQLNLQRWLELSITLPISWPLLSLTLPPGALSSPFSLPVCFSLCFCVALLLPLPLSLPAVFYLSVALHLCVCVCFLLCLSLSLSFHLTLPSFPIPPSPCTRIHFRGIAHAQWCACLYNVNKCIRHKGRG